MVTLPAILQVDTVVALPLAVQPLTQSDIREELHCVALEHPGPDSLNRVVPVTQFEHDAFDT